MDVSYALPETAKILIFCYSKMQGYTLQFIICEQDEFSIEKIGLLLLKMYHIKNLFCNTKNWISENFLTNDQMCHKQQLMQVSELCGYTNQAGKFHLL